MSNNSQLYYQPVVKYDSFFVQLRATGQYDLFVRDIKPQEYSRISPKRSNWEIVDNKSPGATPATVQLAAN